ncbi:MAG: protein phosphatase 2C domain-containing protein [Bifidobacteriaceae bacterium]|jgi:protein phosphatase|nr:protein phosphatase 2C domain-containing protein [Bifidobacteriaceae bacterium]
MPTIAAAAITDTGLVRRRNEDAILAASPVYAVADGMGGHESGQLAAALAVAKMARLSALPQPIGRADVEAALAAAQAAVVQLTHRPHCRAAGTTISAAILVEHQGEIWWLVVNLGDSRTYRLSDGTLEQLSNDHSEVQELVDAGRITPAEARFHPRRNIVTKALGAGVEFEPDYRLVPLRAGDRFLICSDGLTGEVSDHRIIQLLRDNPDPLEAAQSLVGEALRLGGQDNISVIVADVIDTRTFPTTAPPPPASGTHEP